MKIGTSRLLKNATRITLVVAVLFLYGSAATVLAQKINLTLQDAPLVILKDNTATKKIIGIPTDTPGVLKLDFKWHSVNLVPNTFNKLKIELLHGSNVLNTDTCFSIHAISPPRCLVLKTVNQAEANAAGDWKLRISNTSSNDVIGFNILKEATDLNPAFITIKLESTFQPDCNTRDLSIPEVELAPHASTKRSLSIPNMRGEIVIKTKWHVDVLAPFFNPAMVRLLRNGTVVTSERGYSIHSDQKDKLELRFSVVPLTTGTSSWELEITNDGPVKIKGFGIQKGTDPNPFVPQFKSTFKPTCN